MKSDCPKENRPWMTTITLSYELPASTSWIVLKCSKYLPTWTKNRRDLYKTVTWMIFPYSYLEVSWFLKLFGSLMSRFPGFPLFFDVLLPPIVDWITEKLPRASGFFGVKNGRKRSGSFRMFQGGLQICSQLLLRSYLRPKLFDAFWSLLDIRRWRIQR